MKTKKFEKHINPENCKLQLPAASTFKVPLAVMAFDAKVLKNEKEVLRWDGVQRKPEWDHDQNAQSWMKDSVVWFSQRLTPKLREWRLKKYLKKFNYGNQNLSGGITEAWLMPPNAIGTPLSISAYEQVDFMSKLWSDQLPVSHRAQRLTREITFLETSPKSFKLSGKTGSSFYDKKNNIRLGWFIAHLEGGGKEYIVVTNFSDLKPSPEQEFGGLKSKEITKAILNDMGLW
ncbi:MAG: class D beta-lactamase [Bdellovibrio sp.]|nr:class D beta-lactamase [Bdellovibrio sp.]